MKEERKNQLKYFLQINMLIILHIEQKGTKSEPSRDNILKDIGEVSAEESQFCFHYIEELFSKRKENKNFISNEAITIFNHVYRQVKFHQEIGNDKDHAFYNILGEFEKQLKGESEKKVFQFALLRIINFYIRKAANDRNLKPKDFYYRVIQSEDLAPNRFETEYDEVLNVLNIPYQEVIESDFSNDYYFVGDFFEKTLLGADKNIKERCKNIFIAKRNKDKFLSTAWIDQKELDGFYIEVHKGIILSAYVSSVTYLTFRGLLIEEAPNKNHYVFMTLWSKMMAELRSVISIWKGDNIFNEQGFFILQDEISVRSFVTKPVHLLNLNLNKITLLVKHIINFIVWHEIAHYLLHQNEINFDDVFSYRTGINIKSNPSWESEFKSDILSVHLLLKSDSFEKSIVIEAVLIFMAIMCLFPYTNEGTSTSHPDPKARFDNLVIFLKHSCSENEKRTMENLFQDVLFFKEFSVQLMEKSFSSSFGP